MTYYIQIGEEDYIRFNIFHAKYSPVAQRQLRTFWGLFLGMGVALVIVGGLADWLTAVINGLVMGLAALVLRLVMPKLTEQGVKRNIRQMKKDGKLPYHAESEVELGEDVIEWRSEQGVNRIKYSDIEGIYEEPDAIYVYFGVVQAIILPRRCLHGEDGQVLAYLKSKR